MLEERLSEDPSLMCQVKITFEQPAKTATVEGKFAEIWNLTKKPWNSTPKKLMQNLLKNISSESQSKYT